MKQSESDRLVKNLIDKFGLSLKASVKVANGRQYIMVEPGGVHPSEGFIVIIEPGWRSLYIEYMPGKFARDLLDQMANALPENKDLFSTVAKHIINEKAILNFKINGESADPVTPTQWPSTWRTFGFSMKKSPLEINTDDHQLTEMLVNVWVERFFSCVMALSPIEELPSEILHEGLPEGAMCRVLVNKYERNRYNRNICINFHGVTCKVCNINFAETYGEIGTNFIHVHHVIPVSKLGPDYMIDPVEDLVPVCPNCHSMLHKRTIPYTVEELKQIIHSL